jgi:hypothetical protein
VLELIHSGTVKPLVLVIILYAYRYQGKLTPIAVRYLVSGHGTLLVSNGVKRAVLIVGFKQGLSGWEEGHVCYSFLCL